MKKKQPPSLLGGLPPESSAVVKPNEHGGLDAFVVRSFPGIRPPKTSALRRWLREERGRQNYQYMVRSLRQLAAENALIVYEKTTGEVFVVGVIVDELPEEAED